MVLQDRTQKIKEWFNNPYNSLLVVVLTLAFAVRLFFFLKTQNQTLWWDEAEYMSAAKSWAFGVPYDYNPQRPPLFQALSALVLLIGLGEGFIKFVFVVLPSVALVGAVYYLGKEMYNEKIGIIASVFTAVSWTLLFWGARVQPDFFSMTFQVLAILFMWKHWKKPSSTNVILAGLFAALGFYFKVSALLVPMIFIVFILIKDRLSAFKDKYNYYFSFAFLLTLVPYFVWAYIKFNTPFAFSKGYSNAIISDIPVPFGWYNLGFYKIVTDNFLFIVFLLGLCFGLRFLLYLDVLIKEKKGLFNPDLFSVLSLVVVSAFYIFYIRYTDDRWVFLWLPFIFLLSAQVILRVGEYIQKSNKVLGIGLIFLLVGFIGYAQVTHANDLTNNKLESYSHVKEAGIWMKDNSVKGDKIFSVSYTQSVYYTERNVSTYSLVPQLANYTEFDKMILAHRPKYVVWSIFESHPAYMQEWVNQHLSKGDTPVVYAKFVDAQQTQPSIVVFQPDYTKFS